MSPSVSSVSVSDGVATVVVDGEIDLATVGQLRPRSGTRPAPRARRCWT